MIGQQTPLAGNWCGEGLARAFKREFVHGRGRGVVRGISRSKSGEVVICDCDDIPTGRGRFWSYTWRSEHMCRDRGF